MNVPLLRARASAIALLVPLAWLAACRPAAAANWRAPKIPPACNPSAIRERLARVDSAEISRACGNIALPWAYRGAVGRELAMRSYGPHRASGAWAQALARQLLQGGTIDTATKASSTKIECDPAAGTPIYLVSLHARDRTTYALLRFDIGAVVLFDAEEPLGMIDMGQRPDSLWAALAAAMDDDPQLRGPRPAPSHEQSGATQHWDGASAEDLPRPLIQTPPVYPMEARVKDIDGLVLIQAKVDSVGNVIDAVVLRGPPALRDAALEAVWTWHFKPATYRGRPIGVWVMVPVNFRLQ